MWGRQILAGVLPAVVGASALAQAPTCSCGGGTRLTGASLVNTLANRTVCAALGNDSWQEFHSGASGGPLRDYKKGPNDPVDPSETVGTWSVSNDLVTHSYTGGPSYQFQVCQSGNSLDFCGPRNVIGATLRQGEAACNGGTPVSLSEKRATRAGDPIVTPKFGR